MQTASPLNREVYNMAYLKGIVMQQLRKTTWAPSDPVLIGQIALKLSSDSASIEAVRIGTVGGTWETAEPIPTKDYVDSIIPEVGNGQITVKYNQKTASFTVNQKDTTVIDLEELASRDFVTTTLDEYVKSTDLSEELKKYAKTTELNNYYTKTESDAKYATQAALTAEGGARAAEDERLAGLISSEAATRGSADTALGNRIKAVEDWKDTISNVMDFVGAVEALPTSVTGYQKGDVIVVTDGDNAGKEYVNDGQNWVEIGIGSANEAAIATLQGRMTTAEGEIDAIQAKVSGWDSTKSTVDANKATWNKAGTALQESDVAELRTTVSQHDTNLDVWMSGIDTNETVVSVIDSKVAEVTLDKLGGITPTTVDNKISAATVDLATNAALGQAEERATAVANSKVASVAATDNAGIVVNNADAKNPKIGLENLNVAKDLNFYVIKIDKFGRITQAEAITTLDGNA